MPAPKSSNIKIVLLISAVLIVIGTLIYTQSIVRQLLDKEHDIADLYAKSLQFVATSSAQVDYSFVFDEIIRSIDFPMILSDRDNKPMPPFRTSTRNVWIDSTLSQSEQAAYLERLIFELDRRNHEEEEERPRCRESYAV
jgi:hypothetical protein